MSIMRHLVVVTAILLAPLSHALAQEAIGDITRASGEIQVVRSAGGELPGDVGTAIYLYDEVYVADGGEATVTFADNTVLTLSGGSALTVDEFVYDPASQANVGVFNLAGGLLGLVSGEIVKSGDMTVTTPVSTIGIRGTAVLIDSGTRVTRSSSGSYSVRVTSTTGEVVTLAISPDGTLGVVNVTNIATGATTTVNNFGGTVTTTNINGEATQIRSTLTPEDLSSKFQAVLQALQDATGKDLGDPANATEAEALQDAIDELLRDIEEEDASNG